jgi:hypothetical protein
MIVAPACMSLVAPWRQKTTTSKPLGGLKPAVI